MPAELRQSKRLASFTTPLGQDFFSLLKFEAREALSELFVYQVDAVSTTADADLQSIIGEKCSVKMTLKNGQERVFNGVLVDAQWLGRENDIDSYRFILRPWLWLLSQRSDCRIFKNQTPIEIVEAIFGKEGKASFADRVSDKPGKIDYCVQYRETDLDFVLRLLEKHGIYYYFKHTDDDHKLVLSDARTSHDPVTAAAEPTFAGAGTAYPFMPKDGRQRRHIEHLTQWSTLRRLRTGKIELKDYDFEKSTSDLTAKAEEGFPRTKAYESFDYPGAYLDRGKGERLAKVLVQAEQAQDERRQAMGEAPSLHPGALMNLGGHPVGGENKEYLVVRAIHTYGVQSYRSSKRTDDAIYHGSYEFQKVDKRFRAPLTTPSPVIVGPDTAKVVGEKNRGEEGDIDVDKYGRIWLRFHWDREKESTSCRVRVAQVWAGKNWGGQVIPRIGQEVVVEFIEGDPDRPIVTGTVPNDQHMVPYDLPANKTQSGLKSESTNGGGKSGKFNEIKFEDLAGKEVFSMQAQKDHKTEVFNIETRDVGKKFEGGPTDFARTTQIMGGSDKLHVTNGKYYLEAAMEIKLVCGQSEIVMTPMSITIKSTMIKVDGVMTEVHGSATTTITGGIVKIN
ncbi:type VI secretion system Vgr family protein [Bosea sp. (in: a-proteobacteria)]|uniref:type VI secretion system Vgr family protein n=1 Tax=Bosea sp. (in: a-proteobacteria) TaxID=1871050 RepID=UPI002FCB7AAE